MSNPKRKTRRGKPQRPVRLVVSIAVAWLFLTACASRPLARYSEQMPPTVMVTLDQAGVRDLRGQFRAALCPRLAADAPPCDELLPRFPGENDAPREPTRDLRPRYRIVFVPGLFNECLDRVARPFGGVVADLGQDGYDVQFFQVAGRGTVAANAAQLSRSFAALAPDPRPIIVFAFSKGFADVLEMIVRHPPSARQIAAIVGVAGVVNGTPLAEGLDDLYRHLGARFPMPGCAPGNGEEVTDMRRERRLDWWRRHGDAIGVPLFSLVAVPRPGSVSPLLSVKYRRLAQIDPRNDGQLLWYDAIAPRGNLLGYVNADHWTITIDFRKQWPLMADLVRDQVPRTALVEAALEVVDRQLAAASRWPKDGVGR